MNKNKDYNSALKAYNQQSMILKFLKKGAVFILLLGLFFGGGYCIGYYPIKNKLTNSQSISEYYHTKYLEECQMYYNIIQTATNKEIDDNTKLRLIIRTYGNRWEEIDRALKEIKSIERKRNY